MLVLQTQRSQSFFATLLLNIILPLSFSSACFTTHYPFEAGFKCQPTFCCAHSFYNLHAWKMVLEFYEYEDIITFSGWRISGTKTMPHYLSVGLISLGSVSTNPMVCIWEDFQGHHTARLQCSPHRWESVGEEEAMAIGSFICSKDSF